MQASDAMTREVMIVTPEQSVQDAARLMVDIDVGVLPVGEGDRLVGIITDRDIAVRAVALGKGPQTKVRDVMSAEVLYCFEDDDIDDIAENMADVRVRRLPVLNRDKRLVGILSLSDVVWSEGSEPAGRAMEGISKPGGPHSQSAV